MSWTPQVTNSLTNKLPPWKGAATGHMSMQCLPHIPAPTVRESRVTIEDQTLGPEYLSVSQLSLSSAVLLWASCFTCASGLQLGNGGEMGQKVSQGMALCSQQYPVGL